MPTVSWIALAALFAAPVPGVTARLGAAAPAPVVWASPALSGGAPVDGVWLPMSGSAAEASVPALAAAADGSLWAAGGGRVHRLDPGEPWRAIGRYAPELDWDGDLRITVRGPLPPEMLRQVLDDLRDAVEGAGGLVAEEGTIGGEPADDFLAAFVDEAEQSADSPFRVHGAVAGSRSVWLGTGAGLFRASDRGVQGPLPGIPAPVFGVALGNAGVYAATPQGLYRYDNGGATKRLVTADVRAVAAAGPEDLIYVADDHLWRWTEAGGTRAFPTPPTLPRLLGAGGGRVWVAGGNTVYRVRDDGTWNACASLSDVPDRLFADAESLALITEDALHIARDDCQAFDALAVPWPGGMRLLSAARAGGSWFMGATIGTFVLAPALADAEEALAVTGFRRALAQMPSFEQVVDAALDVSGLVAGRVTGARASLAPLLPHLVAELSFDARRRELEPTLETGGGRLYLEPPVLEFVVMARWEVPLDALGRAFGGLFGEVAPLREGDVALEDRPRDDDELTEAQREEDPEASPDDFDDDELGARDELAEDVAAAAGDDEGAPAGGDAEADDGALRRPALAEQRLRGKERMALLRRLQKLYRERQGILYRLWTSPPRDLRGQVLLLLELDEIDAHLDAHTGGDFGRRLAARP